MIRRKRNSDLTEAWIYAANASLYEHDPGPTQLNIASAIEPLMVSRADAFRDLYAHLLLEDLQADPLRLNRLKAAIGRARKRRQTAETETVWAIADELCDRAQTIITGAGATHDITARRRLLAGTKHLNRTVVLGQFVPALQREINNDLLEELDVCEPE